MTWLNWLAGGSWLLAGLLAVLRRAKGWRKGPQQSGKRVVDVAASGFVPVVLGSLSFGARPGWFLDLMTMLGSLGVMIGLLPGGLKGRSSDGAD